MVCLTASVILHLNELISDFVPYRRCQNMNPESSQCWFWQLHGGCGDRRIITFRKDVERSFGILQKRFQFLKNAITWHRKSDIDNAVFSCVIFLVLCYMNLMDTMLDGNYYDSHRLHPHPHPHRRLFHLQIFLFYAGHKIPFEFCLTCPLLIYQKADYLQDTICNTKFHSV